MPNIYLTGMMGSGKSVTGKRLAARLGVNFVDIDEKIQERTKKTIPEIFASEGEAYFREQESQILKEITGGGPYVVATGGGAVLNPANVEGMRGSGKIVFLETSLIVLWDRVKNKQDRPLLKGARPQDVLSRIFMERDAIYQNSCHLKVNTDGKTAGAVADEIAAKLEGKP